MNGHLPLARQKITPPPPKQLQTIHSCHLSVPHHCHLHQLVDSDTAGSLNAHTHNDVHSKHSLELGRCTEIKLMLIASSLVDHVFLTCLLKRSSLWFFQRYIIRYVVISWWSNWSRGEFCLHLLWGDPQDLSFIGFTTAEGEEILKV